MGSGAADGGMRRRALLSTARTALLTAPLVALAGCSGFGSDGSQSPTDTGESPAQTDIPTASPTSTPAAVQAPDGLRVVEHALVRSNEGGSDELVGVDAVIENTGSEATDATATARFYDGSGSLLDESEADTTNLSADGRWSLELLFAGSGEAARAVADYRVVVERP